MMQFIISRYISSTKNKYIPFFSKKKLLETTMVYRHVIYMPVKKGRNWMHLCDDLCIVNDLRSALVKALTVRSLGVQARRASAGIFFLFLGTLQPVSSCTTRPGSRFCWHSGPRCDKRPSLGPSEVASKMSPRLKWSL